MSQPRERKVDDRLADWVDDCLSERERERFLAELRVNPQLRKDLEDYERTVAAVRAALRAPVASSSGSSGSVADRVMQAIAEPAGRRAGSLSAASGPELPRNRFGGPVPRWLPMVGSIAAAAALLAVALWLNSWQTTSQRPDARDDVASVPQLERGLSLPETPADRSTADRNTADRNTEAKPTPAVTPEVVVKNNAASGDEAAGKESNDLALSKEKEPTFDSTASAKARELGGGAKDVRSDGKALPTATVGTDVVPPPAGTDAETTRSQGAVMRLEVTTEEVALHSATSEGSANPSVDKPAGVLPLAGRAGGTGGALVVPTPVGPPPDASHYLGYADSVPPSSTLQGPDRPLGPATGGPATSGPGGPAAAGLAGPAGARRSGRGGPPSAPVTALLRQLPMVTVTATSSSVLESLHRDDQQGGRSKSAATGAAADPADADRLALFFERQILGRDVAEPAAVDVLREQDREQDKDADAGAARKSAPAEGEAKEKAAEKAPVREMERVVEPLTFGMTMRRQRAIDSGLDVGAGLRIAELVEDWAALPMPDSAVRQLGAGGAVEKLDAPVAGWAAPEQRTWVVEGNRAAVAGLLRQLSVLSARAGAQLTNGELPVDVALPWQDRAAADGAAGSSADNSGMPKPVGGRGAAAAPAGGAPGAKAEQQAPAGDVVQVVLRFRVTR